ncbi:plasmid partitioning protein RepB [Mesorhizobium sp. VK4C]|uniref:plasmid partitioning protein RepB n=1 Tax=Mesorhizobium captivum TaxID=3072319 RepID=UPI002A23D0EC|nr:plasmid partitioning protein RepB [Mesorhizobium sp. VK4C]MDX8499018.1 plasmid partitioning protein RepB [Mesorhizobium sp. VK4C]
MSRKQIFANLTSIPSEVGQEDSEADLRSAQMPRRPSRIRPLMGSPDLVNDGGRSPVGALGQSLGELHERARRAAEIEKQLVAGQVVVELDPTTVDPSFVPDRMPTDDEEFKDFVEAIRREGQQVPILVRPNPEKPERYQVAFGHRRLRAALELGTPVKAIVRSLTDQELVVAQGQENNERKDLSYIEKVRFGQKLDEQGFARDVIMSSLSVYKSDLSNMLSVAAKIPIDLIDAIGPAHGVGRRNWMALADAFNSEKRRIEAAREVVNRPQFGSLSSKERFEAVAHSLRNAPLARAPEAIVSSAGKEIGRLAQTKQKVTLTIDRRTSPEFAEFVMREVPRLFDEHVKRR